MKYYSLNNPSYTVDFKEAVITGQAPDKGLFFPAEIPKLPHEFLSSLKEKSKEEIAFQVIKPFVGKDIPEEELFRIVSETVNFSIPLKKVEKGIYTLELFHGPTAAFKDVGARFMSRCLRFFARGHEGKFTILVATSGDTGGAVADAFFNVEGVEVIILFPSKKVSKLQELQLTTYGNNIHALEVEGTFDDCQAMVKRAFTDDELKLKFRFSSANSINIARWLSQQFYYFYAVQQWIEPGAPVVSVPSGNFGNICAGIMAFKTGLQIDSFIAACNDNDVFTRFLQSGNFEPRQAVQTISNAMDVGNPSNFNRVLEAFAQDINELREKVSSFSFDSAQTREAIKEMFNAAGYTMDPHGAVGYLALKQYLKMNPHKSGLFLETAHPAKFSDVVEPVIKQQTEMPPGAEELFTKKQQQTKIPSDYSAFKDWLKSYPI